MCMHVYATCIQMPLEARRGCWLGWKMNWGPLVGQKVIVSDELSL